MIEIFAIKENNGKWINIIPTRINCTLEDAKLNYKNMGFRSVVLQSKNTIYNVFNVLIFNGIDCRTVGFNQIELKLESDVILSFSMREIFALGYILGIYEKNSRPYNPIRTNSNLHLFCEYLKARGLKINWDLLDTFYQRNLVKIFTAQEKHSVGYSQSWQDDLYMNKYSHDIIEIRNWRK